LENQKKILPRAIVYFVIFIAIRNIFWYFSVGNPWLTPLPLITDALFSIFAVFLAASFSLYKYSPLKMYFVLVGSYLIFLNLSFLFIAVYTKSNLPLFPGISNNSPLQILLNGHSGSKIFHFMIEELFFLFAVAFPLLNRKGYFLNYSFNYLSFKPNFWQKIVLGLLPLLTIPLFSNRLNWESPVDQQFIFLFFISATGIILSIFTPEEKNRKFFDIIYWNSLLLQLLIAIIIFFFVEKPTNDLTPGFFFVQFFFFMMRSGFLIWFLMFNFVMKKGFQTT
jgi:hypothetical protein